MTLPDGIIDRENAKFEETTDADPAWREVPTPE